MVVAGRLLFGEGHRAWLLQQSTPWNRASAVPLSEPLSARWPCRGLVNRRSLLQHIPWQCTDVLPGQLAAAKRMTATLDYPVELSA